MRKKTKIVATIGPASEKKRTLESMVEAGMNVCRLNFSHGDHVWHKAVIKRIRAVEKKTGQKAAIMADIQGPRIRIANHRNIKLKEGDKVFLTDEISPHNKNNKKEIILDWNGFHGHIHKKDRVFIEDGMIQLEIISKTAHGCNAEVLVAGTVKPHKGVNIPSISSHLGFLTDKDLDDLEFILSQEVDFLAASFVSSEKDLQSLKNIMNYFAELGAEKKQQKKIPWIISKIERKKAIKRIDKIINASDGIMVARGDLAIEMPQERVTILQKDIIEKCLYNKKPVIVATQMMVSMLENARPTRAEIADLTNAVIDNADAVMLSNETAVGKHPVEVIETMSSVIEATEKSPYNDRKLQKRGKFGRILSRKKKSQVKSVSAKDLETLLNYSSLRQEDVKLKYSGRNVEEKRKAALIWGAG